VSGPAVNLLPTTGDSDPLSIGDEVAFCENAGQAERHEAEARP